jgi:hypothetical protein
MMAAIDAFTPAEISVIRMFASAFRGAPTADLIARFAAARPHGVTAAQQLDFLIDNTLAGSPFTAMAPGSSHATFAAALVDTLTFSTSISAATKAFWAAELASSVGAFASRGAFTAWVIDLVIDYAGNDADLRALKAEVTERTETAAAFALSPSGATWNGQGWGQLLAAQATAVTPPYTDAYDSSPTTAPGAASGGTGPSIQVIGGAGNDTLTISNGGSDTFVFERSGALNGTDTIHGFTSTADKLNVTAFTSAAITAAAAPINGAVGGSFAGVPTTAELVFNQAEGLLSSVDFNPAAAGGRFVLPDGGRSVVAVTVDPTGSGGDAIHSPVRLYFVENGAAPGLSDLSVSLVGIVHGTVEPTLAQMFAALS